MGPEPETVDHNPIIILRSPPTAIGLQNNALIVTHKSGEICSISITTNKRKVLVRERTAVTALSSVDGILLVGTRKGEIKSLVDKKYKKVAHRHTAQIISITAVKTEGGETEIITASTDQKIYLWKLDVNEVKGEKVVHLLFLKALYGPSTPIISTSPSPNRKLLLCTSELTPTTRVFRLEKDTQLLFHIKDYAVRGLFIRNDRFIVISNTNILYVFHIDRTDPVEIVPLAVDTSAEVSSMALLSPDKIAVGFTSGAIILLQLTERLHIVKTLQFEGIPNDFLMCGSVLYAVLGREEKHSRFFIKKSMTNGIFMTQI